MRWPRSLLLVVIFIALLAGFGAFLTSNSLTGQAAPSPATNAAPPPPGAYLTEFEVKSTLSPRRDTYAVYSRLKGQPVEAHTVTKPTYKVGDQESFYVLNQEQKRYFKVTATAVAVTPHVYMFLDNNYHQDKAALARLADQFEQKIYPTTRQYFGDEPNPGVDNDPHLVILNTPLDSSIIGFFSSDNTLLQSVNPYSSEREMFYMGLAPNNTDLYLSTLAHEFQHMIYFRWLPNQDIWLNEGNSILSQVMNGYSSGGVENQYLSTPETQLNAWTCSSCGTLKYYGGGYTWLSFLKDHYGFDMERGIAQNGKGLTGFKAVDHALYYNGHPDLTSDTVFKQFVLANYLNRRTADPAYNYKDFGSRVEKVSSLRNSGGKPEELNQYAARYYSVDSGDKGFTLDFKGDSTVKLAGPGAHSGEEAWWSNRADDTETMLTRTVDLTSVNKATFKFWTWFDIEPNFDWLYVEASTDGGKTWQALKGSKYTTDRDPYGKSYGPGFTGQSLSSGLLLADSTETKANWVQESFDLSAYAGKKIQLRLDYLTDEGYSRQGALFDDFEIPEIGWKDDVESGANGWEAQGFVRSNVTLPQHFWVQVIRRDGPCAASNLTNLATADNGQSCIRDFPLDATNSGRINFPFSKAIVVVAPYAVQTLNPSHYTITLQP
ncbi:MAG TPA: hypothetical protein VH186_28835 [Chloroflexia bacterium]|nr:hypothetical protein [Chloroflexia bacterium]